MQSPTRCRGRANCAAGSRGSCAVCHILCARLCRPCRCSSSPAGKPRECSRHHERNRTSCRATPSSGKRPTGQPLSVLHPKGRHSLSQASHTPTGIDFLFSFFTTPTTLRFTMNTMTACQVHVAHPTALTVASRTATYHGNGPTSSAFFTASMRFGVSSLVQAICLVRLFADLFAHLWFATCPSHLHIVVLKGPAGSLTVPLCCCGPQERVVSAGCGDCTEGHGTDSSRSQQGRIIPRGETPLTFMCKPLSIVLCPISCIESVLRKRH